MPNARQIDIGRDICWLDPAGIVQTPFVAVDVGR
jgi:hypothetical protein